MDFEKLEKEEKEREKIKEKSKKNIINDILNKNPGQDAMDLLKNIILLLFYKNIYYFF